MTPFPAGPPEPSDPWEFARLESTDPPPPDISPPPEVCWRCGLAYAAAPRCPHCAAASRNPGDLSTTPDTPPAGDEWPRLRSVLAAFLLMRAGSVAWAWVVWLGPPLRDDDLLTGTAALEAVDTVITLCLLATVGRMPGPQVSGRARAVAWLSAGPVLAALLAVNFVYAAFFRWLLPHLPEPTPEPLTAATVATVCVQPAVVEELFFRYLVLGVLRRATGGHAAVWASAAMFAAAHLYNPCGMPYLFVAGLAFGYYRVAGGGLALPVVLHFLHNLAVLAAEGE